MTARRQDTPLPTGGRRLDDFSLTAGHVIFYDLPVVFDPSVVAAGAPGPFRTAVRVFLGGVIGRVRIPEPLLTRLPSGTSGFPYTWNPRYPARIGVMPREGGDVQVRWFEIDPCFVFHPLGAYDEGTSVVLDVIRYPSIFDSSRLVPNEGAPRLERWTLDLATGSVSTGILSDRPQNSPAPTSAASGAAIASDMPSASAPAASLTGRSCAMASRR